MRKILVFSDSHGTTHNMRRAIDMHPDAEVIFFLGDGLSDIELFIKDKTRPISYLQHEITAVGLSCPRHHNAENNKE